jgi:acetoin utilization deacetylase AcuC-like enzyme
VGLLDNAKVPATGHLEPMLPFRLVYSDSYVLPIGTHVFPADKYRRTHDRLLKTNAAEPCDFLAPQPAHDEDILLVHTPLYVDKLRKGLLSTREELELEIPYSPELTKAFWLMAGGSMLAADLAMRDGVAIHLGGGFHHAFPDHGEGFCLIHDVAVAIRRLQKDGRIARALVIDCDVHQGNGTAAIFGHGEQEPFPKPSWSAAMLAPRREATMRTSATRDVFTISLHQENNYPAWKPASSVDVNLPDDTSDEEYLIWLGRSLQQAREEFEPELICFIAGADPYKDDQLGGLGLTIEGLRERDRMVFNFAQNLAVPVMATFAGGYAQNIDDTVTIHTNTVLAARDAFGG